MSVYAVTVTALRRLVRDRTAIFFLAVLPVLVIVLVGVSVTDEEQFRVGVVAQAGSPATDALVEALREADAIDVHELPDEETARTALRRGELESVAVVPSSVDEGSPIEVTVVAEPTNASQRAAAAAVAAVVSDQATLRIAADVRATLVDGTLREQLGEVEAVSRATTPVEVRTTVVDADSGYLPGGFSYSAPTMMVLFVFITAMSGAGALIESRRLGIHDRVLAGPVTARTIVAGETMSYFTVALGQALLIVLVGSVAFGVDWGDPWAAAALVVVWCLVGTGAGVLAGTVFRTPEQATAIGVTTGMAAGMLGGCMWPLEIVGDTMRTLGHLLPHAWAVDGWIEVLSRGGGLGQIGRQVGVLAGFAVVLLAAASVRLHARLTR